MNKILFGVDQFCALANDYKDIRIGLVTNDVASNAFGVKRRVALIEIGFHIVKLFSPEHGLSTHATDGTWEILRFPVQY